MCAIEIWFDIEELEGVNRAAVERCNKVLSLLSQPSAAQNQFKLRSLTVEIGEAVRKFRKVASFFGKTLGNARARI